jgi:hemoglobin-like flavoprotein
MAMDAESVLAPEQVARVRATWLRLVPEADAMLQTFYARLFELDPSLRSLFCHVRLPAQRQRLFEALQFIVANLERPEALRSVLGELGARHLTYGARYEHYRLVGEALLWTLDEGLGEVDDASRVAWAAAFDWVATLMLAGARARAPVG